MRLHLLLSAIAMLALTGARPGPGRLLVRSSSVGAVIEVDGVFMGEVPMTLPVVLPAGEHQVRVTLPGHADHVDEVRIRAGRDTVIDAELLALRAVVSIDADAAEARVLVDGQLVGLTPYRGELAPGRVVVEVHASGRAPYRERALFQAGERFERQVVLAPMAAPPPVAAATPWFESWWVWATAGAVVAGAVTTAVVLSASDDDGPPEPRHSLTFEPVR